MPIKLMEVNVSRLARAELTAFFITFYRRVTMVDRDVVRHGIVSTVHFPAHRTHETIGNTFDIFLVAAPT